MLNIHRRDTLIKHSPEAMLNELRTSRSMPDLDGRYHLSSSDQLKEDLESPDMQWLGDRIRQEIPEVYLAQGRDSFNNQKPSKERTKS